MLVIVAEDDVAISDVVKIILEGEGYAVEHATDGVSLMALLEISKPNLILLDISLGNTDGGELTKKLKADQATRQIPIIIMSANTKTEEIAKDVRAEGFLLKPFDISTLISTVQRFCS